MRFVLVINLVWGVLVATALPAWATTQIIMSGSSDDLNATTTEFAGLMGSPDRVWNNNTSRIREHIASSGNLTNLRVVLTAAPGAGTSHTLTIMIDGGASTLSCTVSGTDTSCQDTDTVAVTTGQEWNMRSAHSTTPAVSDAWWSVEFNGTTAGESLISGMTDSSGGTTATRYVSLHGTGNRDTSRTNVETLIPTGGTVKNLYCGPDNDPGVGNTHICTVMLNNVDTALTCTVASGSTNCSDLVNSFSVVAGDLIVLKVVHSAGVASIEVEAGVTFSSTTVGDHLVAFSSASNPSTSAVNYTHLAAGDTGYASTDIVKSLGQVGSVTNIQMDAMYVNLVTAPGAGKSYLVTLYQNGSSTGLACTVADTATTCNNSTNVTIANDDQYSWAVTPSGTPTATVMRAAVLVNPVAATTRRMWFIQ